jgi:lipoprotein-releasing system ATP-binding protein
MIQARHIHKSFDDLKVVKDVSLELQKAEILSIVGSSGAGKSTLLQILGTLSQADQGELIIADTAIHRLNAKELAAFRNEQLGFVFQFHHLLPEFSAIENVCFPAWIKGKPKKDSLKMASELLEILGLSDRIDHKPMELSGGEQQRVAVARALINQPSVVFADEPSGNLDSENAQALHELFFNLRDQFKQSFVIVTHNKELAQMSDRILEMKNGEIVR